MFRHIVRGRWNGVPAVHSIHFSLHTMPVICAASKQAQEVCAYPYHWNRPRYVYLPLIWYINLSNLKAVYRLPVNVPTYMYMDPVSPPPIVMIWFFALALLIQLNFQFFCLSQSILLCPFFAPDPIINFDVSLFLSLFLADNTTLTIVWGIFNEAFRFLYFFSKWAPNVPHLKWSI